MTASRPLPFTAPLQSALSAFEPVRDDIGIIRLLVARALGLGVSGVRTADRVTADGRHELVLTLELVGPSQANRTQTLLALIQTPDFVPSLTREMAALHPIQLNTDVRLATRAQTGDLASCLSCLVACSEGLRSRAHAPGR